MDMADMRRTTRPSQSIPLQISLKDLIMQIINNINSTMPDKRISVVPDKNIGIGDIIAYDPDNDPEKKFEQTIEEFINDYYNCFFGETHSGSVRINYNVTHIPYYTIDINNCIPPITDTNITDIRAYIDRFMDVTSRSKLAVIAAATTDSDEQGLSNKRNRPGEPSHQPLSRGGMNKHNSYTRYKDKNSNYTIVRFNFNSKY